MAWLETASNQIDQAEEFYYRYQYATAQSDGALELPGGSESLDIAAGDEVVVLKPNLGATINAVTADTIARGDAVESAGNGAVRPHGSGAAIGIASKDSDLSGDVGRVEIVIAPLGA